MKVTACGVSLNVDDVPASTAFLVDHFGFRTEMAADGFASLTRDDIGINVIFLRRGLPTLPADQRDDHAGGLILALTVDDLEGELARLQAEGVAITMPLTSEEWGERAFQVRDPNGVIVQLVDWNAPGAAHEQDAAVRRVVSHLPVRYGTLRYACSTLGSAGRGS